MTKGDSGVRAVNFEPCVWNWQVTNSTETVYFTWVVRPGLCTLSELTLVSYKVNYNSKSSHQDIHTP